MNKQLVKRTAAAVLALMMTSFSTVTALAGPGDGISSSSAASSSSTEASADYWTGYTNADGSDFMYLEKGTEVSKFQNESGTINWSKAKADGLDFVMVRIAYGTKPDAYFDENVKGAQAAGIKVGGYLCSTAKSMEEVEAEANLTVDMIRGYQFQYPVAFDIEVRSIIDAGVTKDQLTEMINRYCEIVQTAGYTPMIYANKTWLTQYMNLSQIPYDIWFAAYPSDRVYRPVTTGVTTIWQSSEKGKISGIVGYVTTEFSKKAYGGGSPSWKSARGSSTVSPVSSSTSGSSTGNTATQTTGGSAVVSSSGSQVVISSTGPAGSSSSSGAQSSTTPGSTAEASETKAATSVAIAATADAGAASTAGTTASSTRNGWEKSGEQWYYYENGKTATGWKLVDGKWYYMNSQGIMQTGWLQDQGTYYWLGTGDGAMRTGWRQIDGSWYYFTESGAMLSGVTETIQGVSYSFRENGSWIEGSAS